MTTRLKKHWFKADFEIHPVIDGGLMETSYNNDKSYYLVFSINTQKIIFEKNISV